MDYKLDYIRLLVSDFMECFRFYQNIMGFKATYGDENDVYADFTTGNTTLALFGRPNMSEAVGTTSLATEAVTQDRFCLVFGVESVDAVCKKLESQGISLITQPMDRPGWGIRTAHFRDPDGNLIEINQPLPES